MTHAAAAAAVILVIARLPRVADVLQSGERWHLIINSSNILFNLTNMYWILMEAEMELRHLRYFLVVAEELSFTAAAARLRISQPPLSQQIQILEQELKTALFNRTSRRVELTAAGTAFLEHARSILTQTEQAAEQARAIGLGWTGTLDIGTTGSVILGPLAPLIAACRAHAPQVVVRLHELPPQAQQASLHARRTDISFQRKPADDPDLVVELAWREEVRL